MIIYANINELSISRKYIIAPEKEFSPERAGDKWDTYLF